LKKITGKKYNELENSMNNLGIINESEFTQGVRAITIKKHVTTIA
jgi:hypothetical protein